MAGSKKNADPWLADVDKRMRRFASQHAKAFAKTKREQSGFFEIGCFIALVEDYSKQGFTVRANNLAADGSFRYLTSPNGNPDNFSYVTMDRGSVACELRQQIRLRSVLHPDIAFTPDMVVLRSGTQIDQIKDPDYANGKRGMFAAPASAALAVHECKSLVGFPELYVSFLGMLSATGHPDHITTTTSPPLGHLASTLFVGGESSALHLRMLEALSKHFPVNIVTGLHKGGWVLTKGKKPMNRV